MVVVVKVVEASRLEHVSLSEHETAQQSEVKIRCEI